MAVPDHLQPGRADEQVVALVAAARSMDARAFCSHFILDRVPWIFMSRDAYVDWKQGLARGLEVDPYALCIVGSAATGVSLSPSKELRLFRPESDVDVAVISAHHFDIAWRVIRGFGEHDATLSSRQRRGLGQHRGGLLFDGCIATDRILRLLPFGPAWSEALRRAGSEEPVQGHTVKARLYRDFEALRSYQLKSALLAKERLEDA